MIRVLSEQARKGSGSDNTTIAENRRRDVNDMGDPLQRSHTTILVGQGKPLNRACNKEYAARFERSRLIWVRKLGYARAKHSSGQTQQRSQNCLA